MDPRRQKSLMEAAISVVVPKQEINESVEQVNEQDVYAAIAEGFIGSVLGNQLNESTDQERTLMIADLIEQTNIVCHAVNTYFGLQD